MKMSADIGALAAALAKAQGAIKNAARDAENPFFKSAYAPLDTVIDTIKAEFAKNELAYFQSPKSQGSKVEITTLIVHSSGQWMETDALEATAKDAAPQSVGSATTYLRRYSLMSAAGIAARDDDDAEATEGRQHENKGKKPAVTTVQGKTEKNGDARAALAKAREGAEADVSHKEEAKRRLTSVGVAKPGVWLADLIGKDRVGDVWTAEEWKLIDTKIVVLESAKTLDATVEH